MAQRVQTVFIDDLDNSEVAEIKTVNFSVNGRQYEIDLAPKNREKLDKALAPFVKVARPISKVTRQRRTQRGPTPADVREWARENDIEVPDRGRIPNSVVEQYEAAH